MTPDEHIAEILCGDMGPETLRWLTHGFKVSVRNGLPLDRGFGLHKGARAAFFVGQRDQNLADGAELAGGSRRYLDEYQLWRIGQWTGNDNDLVMLFEELALLESQGFGPPGVRQAQRAASRCDKKSPPNVVPFSAVLRKL